jgi:hypothetical protein
MESDFSLSAETFSKTKISFELCSKKEETTAGFFNPQLLYWHLAFAFGITHYCMGIQYNIKHKETSISIYERSISVFSFEA